MKSSDLPQADLNRGSGILRSHWGIAVIATLGLVLLFANLGSDYLWADEGDTAVLASAIVKYGIPKAWDGVTFTDSDKGTRENDDLVMVSHPWLQYYFTAGSFLLFGENTFAARFPFAVAGWITILLVYALVRRVTPERVAALAAALLTVLSVQFVLYSRQCRNYSLHMLFTCWLFWSFFRMRTARGCILFAVSAILLFHTSPFGLAPLGVLGLLTLVYRPFYPQRRWFWLAMPAVAILTLPWLVQARSGYAEHGEALGSAGEFFGRFAQYLIECASVTPLIGIAILFLAGFVRSRWLRKESGHRHASSSPLPNPEEVGLILLGFATLLFYGLVMAITQSTGTQWFVGLRYATPAIPLVAMIAGILIARISRGRIVIWASLLLLFGFTKLAQLTPWTIFAPKIVAPGKDVSAAVHPPARILDGFLMTEQWFFLNDLWRQNPGTVATTAQFLRAHAKPGERLIVNYDWEPLYFHTRLPQALKILPNYSVYEAARRKGLPEYVFGVDHVRWVAWRPIWEGYQGYRLATVEHDILAEGGHLKEVAQMDETLWENRENIHFRRFSGGRYIFARPERLPPAIIFRVEWPEDAPSANQLSLVRPRRRAPCTDGRTRCALHFLFSARSCDFH
jgi:4-amino-4-deoxy-L-arabinose transferase-like glycosyltransferase